MLNKTINFALHNRILIIVMILFLLSGGSYYVLKSDIDVFPDLNAPTVVVMTEAPGYASEEIERTVTFPIETVMNGATGVRRVRSSSSTGFSVVWVEFDWDTDIYRDRQIVSEKLLSVASQFPNGVKEPVLGPQSSILGEMLIVGLTADSTSLDNVRTIADRTLRPRLLSLGGIAEVQVIGGGIKEYQILLDLDRMKHFDVSIDEVQNAAQSVNNNVGGGILYEYGNEYIIKGNINTTSLTDIANTVVRSDSRGTVLLSDVARVQLGTKSPKLGLASENAKPAVLLTVTKQPNADTNTITDNVVSALDEMKKNL
ncbi:MAG: efflux RND transporter permease subunit, partial [Muribaculaceae bacterium]